MACKTYNPSSGSGHGVYTVLDIHHHPIDRNMAASTSSPPAKDSTISIDILVVSFDEHCRPSNKVTILTLPFASTAESAIKALSASISERRVLMEGKEYIVISRYGTADVQKLSDIKLHDKDGLTLFEWGSNEWDSDE